MHRYMPTSEHSPVKLALSWSRMYCLSSSEMLWLFLTVFAYTPYSCSAASFSSPSTFSNMEAGAWHTGHSAGGSAPS